LTEDDIERILLSDSERNLTLSEIEDLSTHKASDSVGYSTSPLQGRASDTSFMWEDMSNYVGRRE
jgi:hypothetical protein